MGIVRLHGASIAGMNSVVGLIEVRSNEIPDGVELD